MLFFVEFSKGASTRSLMLQAFTSSKEGKKGKTCASFSMANCTSVSYSAVLCTHLNGLSKHVLVVVCVVIHRVLQCECVEVCCSVLQRVAVRCES